MYIKHFKSNGHRVAIYNSGGFWTVKHNGQCYFRGTIERHARRKYDLRCLIAGLSPSARSVQ